jgi:hypothetical protein
VWHEGRQRPATVSISERPGCFAGPTGATQSGCLASLRKKDERQRPRVFLILKFILRVVFQYDKVVFVHTSFLCEKKKIKEIKKYVASSFKV